jgi:hypothetical protein
MRKSFVLSKNVHTASRAHSASYSTGERCLFPRGLSGRGVRLTNYFHVVPRLRMCGAILPLILYGFLAWIGTDLPFFFETPNSVWFIKSYVHLRKLTTGYIWTERVTYVFRMNWRPSSHRLHAFVFHFVPQNGKRKQPVFGICLRFNDGYFQIWQRVS